MTSFPLHPNPRIRAFLAWRASLPPGEAMAAFFTSEFRDLSPADLREARLWSERQVDAELKNFGRLAARVAHASRRSRPTPKIKGS